MAVGYVRLEDCERALDWLESGYDRNPMSVAGIKVEPDLDPLHGHPRFQKLLAMIVLSDPQ